MPQEKFKTLIGGQALIEGIYMRGPDKQSLVVRKPDGELESRVEPLRLIKDRFPILGFPFIRGVVNFGSSMVNGIKSLMTSASYLPEDEQEEPGPFGRWIEKHFGSEKLEQWLIYSAAVLGVIFAVALFALLPTFLVSLIRPIHDRIVLRNLLEGVMKVVVFVVYLALISRLPDIQRVFQYHGAEHKTIRCYEAKLPLTVENVKPMTRLHPRCGTSFLFVVIILSILIGSVIQTPNTLLRILCKLALLPVVVSVAYECNRLVGRYDNLLTRTLSAPGMWFQHLTTREPDESMIEVGIEALRLVIPDQEGADRW
ncbi:MAG: DUF1385 domain-containing protein [Oscillospiraceae bacterium]|nr:DUF1385 domain-containing protein [Oscillospiraceae bacterium]